MLSAVPLHRDEADDLRLPPSNIEAEEAILGGILIDPEAIARIEPLLTPDDFYIRAHAHIYAAALALKKENAPTDLMHVATRLKDASRLESIGGQLRLVQLVDRCISAANIDHYGQLVADKALRRRLGAAARKVEQISLETFRPLSEAVTAAEKEIFAVTQQLRTGSAKSAAEISTEAFANIEMRSQGLSPAGIESGFYDLDAMTQGFQPKDLIVAAGRPGMGKTSLITCVAMHTAQRQQRPVLIISLEMSSEQLIYRMFSPIAKIESGRLRTGKLAPHDWEPLGQAMATVSQLPIFIDDSRATTVTEIASIARELKAQQGDLGIIFVDYLQLMEGDGENRAQDLDQITRSLRRLAGELNVPVVALSQLSRGVESRTNKRPMMSDLRESGGIEQNSDLILMLYREEYYDPDTPERGITELITVKNRHGATGTVKLLFDAQYTQFLNRSSLR